MNTKQPKIYGTQQSSPERRDYGITSLLQETRIISTSLTLNLRGLEKEQGAKPKVSRRKEIIKIRMEINKIESKNNTKGQ